MRRYVPIGLLGLLTVGTVIGIIVALGNSTPSTPVVPPAGATAVPASAPVSDPTTPLTPRTTLPAAADHTPACTLVTPHEASKILNQYVNNPGRLNKMYCGYGGLTAVAPAVRPPTLTVTVLVNPTSVASAKALVKAGFPVDCGAVPQGQSCTSVARANHRTTVDGVSVIWDQTASVDNGNVGTAIGAIDGRAVLIAVTGRADAGTEALEAIRLALPRL